MPLAVGKLPGASSAFGVITSAFVHRMIAAVLIVVAGTAGCSGGSSSKKVTVNGQQSSTTLPKANRTVTIDQLPADLKNLWDGNVHQGDKIEVIDTPNGPVYLVAARRFAFGRCAATRSLPSEVLVAAVCNP